MSKTVILAEKPSVGREIARVLGLKNSKDGYIEGEKYIVTWALGHLVTLEEPESYSEKYKTWSMDYLPMLPEKMRLKVIPKTAKQFGIVKKLLLSKETDSLIIATDAGREGELVARWIIEKAGFKKPIKRLWISSQTDKAIKDGFKSLADGRKFDNLYFSADARAEADWLVGLNVTRALTCKYNAQLSAGRVQTPTLSLIVKRENEIKSFVPKEYFNITANLNGVSALFYDKNNQTAVFDRKKAEEIVKKVSGESFAVKAVKVSKKHTPAPMLYDLTELQRDASNIFHMSPKETLNTMQNLYEKHKALTYPRTDSRFLTEDIVPTLSERLKASAKGDFAPFVSEILKNKMKISSACINNAKVSDHHAIIPTEEHINASKLSSEEKRIYFLVVKRFLECFYPPFEYNEAKITFEAKGETFKASGQEVLNKGFKKISEGTDTQKDTKSLPPFKENEKFTAKAVELKVLKTTPPQRYTEGTLLSAMENPSAFISDKSMKEYIDSGLGTPATRADIIEKLFSSFYVEKSGTSIVPTSKGIQIASLAPKDLTEPLLTAKWEKQLEEISRGVIKKKDFVDKIKNYTESLVTKVKESEESFRHDNLTQKECPICGKRLLSVNGKHGKMLVCQDRECAYRQTVLKHTNMRCPICHKKMDMFGEGEGKTYVCVCGFKEKAGSFHEKLKKRAGADKTFVKTYMKKQNKDDDDKNNALADAFKKAFENK